MSNPIFRTQEFQQRCTLEAFRILSQIAASICCTKRTSTAVFYPEELGGWLTLGLVICQPMKILYQPQLEYFEVDSARTRYETDLFFSHVAHSRHDGVATSAAPAAAAAIFFPCFFMQLNSDGNGVNTHHHQTRSTGSMYHHRSGDNNDTGLPLGEPAVASLNNAKCAAVRNLLFSYFCQRRFRI